jgi:hypothetical protein
MVDAHMAAGMTAALGLPGGRRHGALHRKPRVRLMVSSVRSKWKASEHGRRASVTYDGGRTGERWSSPCAENNGRGRRGCSYIGDGAGEGSRRGQALALLAPRGGTRRWPAACGVLSPGD